MGTTILTSLSESELRSCIKEEIKEALKDLNLNERNSSFEILSIDEASGYLNLAKATIYGLTSKRIIPFIKRGKKLYFKKSDLLAWLDNGKRQSKAEIVLTPQIAGHNLKNKLGLIKFGNDDINTKKIYS